MEASSSRKRYDGSKTLHFLPWDVTTEILLRLPVKSLLKFKLVCKTWRSLIASSRFSKAHLNHSKNSKNYANHRVLLIPRPEKPYSTYTCSLPSILDNTALVNPESLYNPNPRAGYLQWIFGNCNGLLCVQVDNYTLSLYNPTTRKSKILPASGSDRSNVNSYYTYGVWYHESEDDYRVVELRNVREHIYDYVTVVMIYSLRTNSWRKIDDELHHSASSQVYVSTLPGIPIDGILNWAISDVNLSQIFAVNTVTYTHQTLVGPDDTNMRNDIASSGVMDFGGCLGVYYCYRTFGVVDILVMKESWTKVVSMSCNVHPYGYFLPLIVSKDGEILLENISGYPMIYNSREKTFIKQVKDFRVSHMVSSPVYMESLVDPSL